MGLLHPAGIAGPCMRSICVRCLACDLAVCVGVHAVHAGRHGGVLHAAPCILVLPSVALLHHACHACACVKPPGNILHWSRNGISWDCAKNPPLTKGMTTSCHLLRRTVSPAQQAAGHACKHAGLHENVNYAPACRMGIPRGCIY